jgi:hypothetical protein
MTEHPLADRHSFDFAELERCAAAPARTSTDKRDRLRAAVE